MNRTILLRNGSLHGQGELAGHIDDEGITQMMHIAKKILNDGLEKNEKSLIVCSPRSFVIESANIIGRLLRWPVMVEEIWGLVSGATNEARFKFIRNFHKDYNDSTLIVVTHWPYIDDMPEMLFLHFEKFRKEIPENLKGKERLPFTRENFGLDIKWSVQLETLVIKKINLVS